jgi:sRNA-binding protein
MKIGDEIRVRLTGDVQAMTVLKVNKHTVWGKLLNGDVIKRHKRKHVVL